jgi:5-carboxymethyl-2-hydroxymuconate isomerase
MTGTASQVQWAAQIRLRTAAEFDRVANAFKVAAGRQSEQDRIETQTAIAILEEKRAEVMANDSSN